MVEPQATNNNTPMRDNKWRIGVNFYFYSLNKKEHRLAGACFIQCISCTRILEQNFDAERFASVVRHSKINIIGIGDFDL